MSDFKWPWRAEYNNDVGPDDEGFWEWWSLLDADGNDVMDSKEGRALAVAAPEMYDLLERLNDPDVDRVMLIDKWEHLKARIDAQGSALPGG